MKILAVDTATSSCSVAIVDGGALRAELTQSTGETHARHLMSMVGAAFDLAGMSVNDMDGFVAITGPGTFTGLRIGLSTVQGMALAASKPVVGISSLDALSVQAAPTAHRAGSLICAMLDARRKEVYYNFYRSTGHAIAPVAGPRVGPPEIVAGDIDEPCLLVGSGALLYQEVLKEKLAEKISFAALSAHTIRGETVARLSLVKFENRDVSANGILQPLYLRKSDAEVNAARQAEDA
ncbi:MAG: tRNA (adenosine(37)-N6)-threonylcarbamoyltransferase complex dimerization subunit type 1 TsaB [Deltaproteobacteria bacterium]|nr:tRNA (adenosine(37)-N6)-threonylcarbamoyltransferase complex dimerization subunit type 1 TsaB [Deltaproteobacteria bacterium]MBW2297189.1 tRNA (adenosine(37)-N6)-threonylcarbamoyltransferase complex dimerization subunit type 1 TsaB [Deltaproteobacteria bacterium]